MNAQQFGEHGEELFAGCWMHKPGSKGSGIRLIGGSKWNRRFVWIQGNAVHYGPQMRKSERAVPLAELSNVRVCSVQEIKTEKGPDNMASNGWKLSTMGKSIMFVCEKSSDRDKWVIGLNAFLKSRGGDDALDEDEEALYREARSSQRFGEPPLDRSTVYSRSTSVFSNHHFDSNEAEDLFLEEEAARELYEKHQTKKFSQMKEEFFQELEGVIDAELQSSARRRSAERDFAEEQRMLAQAEMEREKREAEELMLTQQQQLMDDEAVQRDVQAMSEQEEQRHLQSAWVQESAAAVTAAAARVHREESERAARHAADRNECIVSEHRARQDIQEAEMKQWQSRSSKEEAARRKVTAEVAAALAQRLAEQAKVHAAERQQCTTEESQKRGALRKLSEQEWDQLRQLERSNFSAVRALEEERFASEAERLEAALRTEREELGTAEAGARQTEEADEETERDTLTEQERADRQKAEESTQRRIQLASEALELELTTEREQLADEETIARDEMDEEYNSEARELWSNEVRDRSEAEARAESRIEAARVLFYQAQQDEQTSFETCERVARDELLADEEKAFHEVFLLEARNDRREAAARLERRLRAESDSRDAILKESLAQRKEISVEEANAFSSLHTSQVQDRSVAVKLEESRIKLEREHLRQVQAEERTAIASKESEVRSVTLDDEFRARREWAEQESHGRNDVLEAEAQRQRLSHAADRDTIATLEEEQRGSIAQKEQRGLEELYELRTVEAITAMESEEVRVRGEIVLHLDMVTQQAELDLQAWHAFADTFAQESIERSSMIDDCLASWIDCETSEREELEGFLGKKHRRVVEDAIKQWNDTHKPAPTSTVEVAAEVAVPPLQADDVETPNEPHTTNPSSPTAAAEPQQQQQQQQHSPEPTPSPRQSTTKASTSPDQAANSTATSPDNLAASRRSRNRSGTTLSMSVRVNQEEARRRAAEQERQMQKEADEVRAFAARGSWMHKPGSQSQTKSVFRFGGSTWNNRYVWVVGERLLYGPKMAKADKQVELRTIRRVARVEPAVAESEGCPKNLCKFVWKLSTSDMSILFACPNDTERNNWLRFFDLRGIASDAATLTSLRDSIGTGIFLPEDDEEYYDYEEGQEGSDEADLAGFTVEEMLEILCDEETSDRASMVEREVLEREATHERWMNSVNGVETPRGSEGSPSVSRAPSTLQVSASPPTATQSSAPSTTAKQDAPPPPPPASRSQDPQPKHSESPQDNKSQPAAEKAPTTSAPPPAAQDRSRSVSQHSSKPGNSVNQSFVNVDIPLSNRKGSVATSHQRNAREEDNFEFVTQGAWLFKPRSKSNKSGFLSTLSSLGGKDWNKRFVWVQGPKLLYGERPKKPEKEVLLADIQSVYPTSPAEMRAAGAPEKLCSTGFKVVAEDRAILWAAQDAATRRVFLEFLAPFAQRMPSNLQPHVNARPSSLYTIQSGADFQGPDSDELDNPFGDDDDYDLVDSSSSSTSAASPHGDKKGAAEAGGGTASSPHQGPTAAAPSPARERQVPLREPQVRLGLEGQLISSIDHLVTTASASKSTSGVAVISGEGLAFRKSGQVDDPLIGGLAKILRMAQRMHAANGSGSTSRVPLCIEVETETAASLGGKHERGGRVLTIGPTSPSHPDMLLVLSMNV